MAESFGARLRQQRERQLIALSTIADRTKINQSLLEGLEQDDVSHWPCGIFRRSFVRAYAQQIGLDPETVVREFVELHPEAIEDAAVVPAGIEAGAGMRRPPMRLRYLIDSAVRAFSRAEAKPATPVPASQSPASRPTAEVEPIQRVAPWARAAIEPVPISVQPVMSTEPPELPQPVIATTSSEPNLSAVAHVCTQLARVLAIRDVGPLLEGAASLLDAVGVVVWLWDPQTTALRPALSHGYSDDVLAKLPKVRRDTDNATAASFRMAQTRIVNSTDESSGAVVVPLLTPDGCVGVFAVEVRPGGEQKESVRALAAIFAAQLATSLGFSPLAEAVNA